MCFVHGEASERHCSDSTVSFDNEVRGKAQISPKGEPKMIQLYFNTLANEALKNFLPCLDLNHFEPSECRLIRVWLSIAKEQ